MTKRNTLILCLLALTLIAIILYALNVPALEAVTCSIIPMATIGSIDDVNDRDVAGNSISTRVWLLSLDQINRAIAYPKANASREISNIPLINGQYWHYIEGHTYPTDESTLEKGDLTVTSKNSLALIVGSNDAKLLDFVENHVGGKFVLVYYDFVEDKYFILGGLHYPMILKSVTRSRNKERKAIDLKFENEAFMQPYIYVGQLTTSAPADVATATIAVTSSCSEYNITGATDITGVTGVTANDVGRHILITGSGGASIAESSTFILKGGEAWTANAGSKIEFKIYDSQPTLIEVDGSRVQTA